MVADCCATYTQELHDGSVRAVAKNFGSIVLSEDLATYWKS
jgi:hypothetical protein